MEILLIIKLPLTNVRIYLKTIKLLMLSLSMENWKTV